METPNELIKDLQTLFNELKAEHQKLVDEFDQYQKESIKWSVEDFQDKAKEIGYTITEEQAQEALEAMIHHHDCQYGITWNNVEYYVQDYGERISDERIAEFLDRFCTEVKKKEDSAYVELMMDDHFCIEYGTDHKKRRIQYYVPENNMMYAPEDEYIRDYLEVRYGL